VYDIQVLRARQPADSPAAPPPPREAEPEPSTVIRLGRGQSLRLDGSREQYDFFGGKFYQASRALSERLPYYGLSATDYDVWHTLLGNQVPGGIVPLTQRQIAERLGIDKKEVGTSVRRLMGWGFVYAPKRGVYRINPRVAFYGRSGSQEEALAELPRDVPHIQPPDHKVRPPRRTRKPKGVT